MKASQGARRFCCGLIAPTEEPGSHKLYEAVEGQFSPDGDRLGSPRRWLAWCRDGFLVEADDGFYYVTLASSGPLRERALINEWIGSRLLSTLGVQTPAIALLELSIQFLDSVGALRSGFSNTSGPIPPGLHLGIRLPGHPDRTGIYDYLPRHLLLRVGNRADFFGALCVDRWGGYHGSRRAFFCRTGPMRPPLAEEHPLEQLQFTASLIESNRLFGHTAWRLDGPSEGGLFSDLSLYEPIPEFTALEPWIAAIQALPESALLDAVRSIPAVWLDREHAGLSRLLDTLWSRRDKLQDLLWETVRNHLAPNRRR